VRTPAALYLEDIAADGRVLLRQEERRYEVAVGQVGGETHLLSWLEIMQPTSMSRDGKYAPWRGGRTEFWVPPDIGSAHSASRALYRVLIPTRADRSKATASPSTAASSTSPTCSPPTVGKIPPHPPLPSHLGSALADNEAILSCRLKLSFVTKIRAART
jgi:hypothetical protein